jgi:hypothetical protein
MVCTCHVKMKHGMSFFDMVCHKMTCHVWICLADVQNQDTSRLQLVDTGSQADWQWQ